LGRIHRQPIYQFTGLPVPLPDAVSSVGLFCVPPASYVYPDSHMDALTLSHAVANTDALSNAPANDHPYAA
jgi:hypothetical protein